VREAVVVLEDGSYDVIVVDVTDDGGKGADRVVALELAVLAGSHKGEVVTVHAAGLRGDELDLLGIPGTLTVLDGEPSVQLEP
jgi:hypothetical protein